MGNWDTSDFSLLHAQMQQVIAFISYVSGEPFDRVSTSLRGKKSMGWMGKNRDTVSEHHIMQLSTPWIVTSGVCQPGHKNRLNL